MRRIVVRLFALLVVVLGASLSSPARADEGGASFWLPGQFGSLAAVPTDAGASLGAVYFHQTASSNASMAFQVGGQIALGLDVDVDLLFLVPTYTFDTPVLGGQAALSLTAILGQLRVGANATLSGPNGGVIAASKSDSIIGGGDLFPQGTLKWNDGNNNYMLYTMAGIPTGAYQATRLANLGSNHWAIDAGGGYTYLNATSGLEFSAVVGATYNFENSATSYQNGIDGHLDWGASQFVSEKTHVGLVGYFFQQLTGDSGAGAKLGDFKGRVSAVGPQVGTTFPLLFGDGTAKGYVNLKGYWEFDAANRPSGWNAWLTVSVPLGAARN